VYNEPDTLTQSYDLPPVNPEHARAAKRRDDELQAEYLRAVAAENAQRDAANRSIVWGGALFALGLVITLLTYSHASTSGGTYIIAWGPVVFGLIRLVRGLAARP
jgi:hypothetical protein